MEKLEFSIAINAPRQHVWNVMLQDTTYREWTSAFHPGSYYEGSWDEGAEIRFLSPGGNGMIARIAENRPPEFVSIEHFGFIAGGVVDTTGAEAKAMAGAHENYTLSEADGVTTVSVAMDTTPEFNEMFAEMWPRALQQLKAICER